MTIKAKHVATLERSDFTVALTTGPGTVTIPSVAGDRRVAYETDAVVISDRDATTIAGPISREHAIALATAVLEGQRRAITHPQLHLLLAGAVLAFVPVSPEPPVPDDESADDD